MNGLVAWWARNGVAANLLMVGVLLAGMLSFIRMEREVFPSFALNWVEVTVNWPGAAPQEVEEQVILRIEEALVDLDNVERLNALAQEGFGRVSIEADPRIDIAEFINEVKLRVDSISSFPVDIDRPRVAEVVARAELAFIVIHGDVSERILKRAAEQARNEITLLPGASLTRFIGMRDEEVSIEVSEEALRRYLLTFDDVAQAVRNSSLNQSAGTVRTDTGVVQLRARNLADTRSEFERIIVRQTEDGATVRVGDVATVIDGFIDVDRRTLFNGSPGLIIAVQGGDRANVVQTSQSLKEWIETADERLPAGVQATLWYDDSKVYFDRMETISTSAALGLVLVFLILILFLRTTVAIWVTVGIATAFAGAFVLLPGLDVSLNMLTLFAFLLVIGVVVDDAIIVGEKIHAQVEAGQEGLEAAVVGTQLVLKPVIFAVATTMIAFAPWLFLSGAQVQVTRQMSLIIICALSFSLIEALLILPSHLSHMRPKTKFNALTRVQKVLADGMIRFAQTVYRPLVTFCIRQRYLTISVFTFFLVISFALVSTGFLRFSFSPEIESDFVQISIDFPDGTTYERADAVLDLLIDAQAQVKEGLREQLGGEDIFNGWFASSTEGEVDMWLTLMPPERRDIPSKDIAVALREAIGDVPDADSIVIDFTINTPDPEVEFAVNAPDLDVLRAAVSSLNDRLRTYDQVIEVRDNLQSATDELRLTLRPGAVQLGLTLADVSRQVRQAYFGEEVQRLPRTGGDVRVYVRYPKTARRDLESLQNLRIRTNDGREVPLSVVAEISFGPGQSRIDRRERQRSSRVSADLRSEEGGSIRRDLEESFFPDWESRFPTVSRGAIGQSEGQARFLAEVQSLYLVAFLTMYALLAVAFQSYWQPLLIMTAIPFGFMGAVYGHMMLGLTMALFSYFGIAAAAGVVVNDNLVLMDSVNRMRQQGATPMTALVESGVGRFRPIILTSVTTFIGLVPMISEQSIQAQFLKPTVVALAFGIIFATFVTLLLIPALYAAGVDIARLARGLWTGQRQPSLEHNADAEP